eukprot:scaffold31383_cov18-Tisochrysis_lutea.AAC.1
MKGTSPEDVANRLLRVPGLEGLQTQMGPQEMIVSWRAVQIYCKSCSASDGTGCARMLQPVLKLPAVSALEGHACSDFPGPKGMHRNGRIGKQPYHYSALAPSCCATTSMP